MNINVYEVIFIFMTKLDYTKLILKNINNDQDSIEIICKWNDSINDIINKNTHLIIKKILNRYGQEIPNSFRIKEHTFLYYE